MIQHRNEIDGLRALAIIPVVLFHAQASIVPGGFLGVDIFFVISGYLITSIIVKDLEQNRFSITQFYERRARRILPALFLVLITTTLVFSLVYTSARPAQIEDLGNSVISVLFFVSNIYFFTQSGYFGTASETTPLLHTWSLAVEEQFYLFFPLVLMAMFTRRKQLLFGFIILATVLSLAISEWGYRNSPVGNFFLTPSRVWELMFGAIAALIYQHAAIRTLSPKLQNTLGLLGLVMVIASMFAFSESTPHPSLLTLIPIAGTTLIILFGSSQNLSGRILSVKPAVYIGLISYSLYLWHQPALALIKYLYNFKAPWFMTVLALAAVLVLSHLSWKYVETPFRKQQFNRAQIFKYSLNGSLAFLTIGLVLAFSTPILNKVKPTEMQRYAVIQKATSPDNNVLFQDGCIFWSSELNARFERKFNECAKQYGPGLIITGGSHGMDLYNAFALHKPYPFIAGLSKGYCRAHTPVTEQPFIQCHYQDLERFISTHKDSVKRIVYTQTPDRLFRSGFVEDHLDDITSSAIDEVVEYLAKLHKDYAIAVDMFGMQPILTRLPQDLDINAPLAEQLPFFVSAQNTKGIELLDATFANRLADTGVGFFTKTDLYGLKLPEDLFINNQITYSDRRHTSSYGEYVFGGRMITNLVNQGYFE